MNGGWYGWPQGRVAQFQTFIGWALGLGRVGFYGGGGSGSWTGGAYVGGDLQAHSWTGGAIVS